ADDEPFGVSNAQLHDEGSLTNLNNNQNTFCIIVDGNGHVNEDGTLYTHTNEDIIPQNLHPDAIIGSENGSESNDEYDSTNENEKENEIIKNTQNVNYHAQTNDQINQINGADEEHTRRDTGKI
ncbi:unnamed protein product, partial [Rotaria sp. Silwood2]